MTPGGSDSVRELQRFSSEPATVFIAMRLHVLYKEKA